MPVGESGSSAIADENGIGPVYLCDGFRVPAGRRTEVLPFDFRNPTSLPEVELRRLRSTYSEFAKAIASRFSSLLRCEVIVDPRTVEAQPFESWVEALKTPTHTSLFRVTPLNGIGIVVIPPKLAVALTNRILGGREPAGTLDTSLTEIETALLEDVLSIIIGEWCEQWRDETALDAQLMGHESNPKFLNAGEKNQTMLIAALEVAFGRCEEALQVAVPVTMIEPMMKRFYAARDRESRNELPKTNASWRKSYSDIVVPVHAEMKTASLTVAELLKLKVGDVIELSASALEATLINIAGSIRFSARAGQKDGRVAIKLQEVLHTTRKE